MPYKDKKKGREHGREYIRRPEVQEHRREYNRRPEVMEKAAKYRALPESQKIRDEYRARPGGKEEKAEKQRQYRAKPEVRETDLERQRQYRKRPDVMTKKNAYDRQMYASYVTFKLEKVLRARLHHALKKKSKCGSAVKLLGCTTEEARIHIENQFQDGMSWSNWNMHGWHLDHRLPVSFFNLQDPAQLAVAFHFSNLQPLWAFDNLSKHDKMPVE